MLTWTCHTPETLAYLAGVFDADGCVCIRFRRQGSVTISARITSVNKDYILWLQEQFGGWTAGQRQPVGNRREAFNWGVDAHQSIGFFEAVLPYLHLKKAEVEIALELQRLVSARYRTGNRLSDDEVAQRAALVEAFRSAKDAR